jgi:hypothetical protein
MIIFAFFRFGAVIIKKDREHLYYDSLLFAGIAYSSAYVLLHLNYAYYFLPSIILFLPSLVYWTKYLYRTKKIYAFLTFGFIMGICFFNVRAMPGMLNYTWQNRKEFIPYISSLLSEYKGGKKFIWYESDNAVTDNTFYKDVREWRKYIENAFLNYMNKSKGSEFFTVTKNVDEAGLHEGVLFFYPVDNDQNQPMSDNLVKALSDNNFELFMDSYGILIYRQR